MVLRPAAIALVLLSHNAANTRSIEVKNTRELNSAMTNLFPGDTLRLNNGVYEGSFDICTPSVLICEANAVVDGLGEGDVVTISADSVVLQGMTIRNSGTRLLKDMAGLKITGNFATVSNCRIEDALHGIYVKGGNNAKILDNTIIGRFEIQEADRGNGIHLWNTSNNVVEGNDISFARDGIYFSFANQTTVRNNHIHHLRYALHYMYSDDNYFEYNVFDHNVAGSALMYSKNIEFSRNVFAHCRGFRAYGILLQSVNYCKASDNLILDNTKGVFFDDANYCSFTDNDIVQNDLALQIKASCEENSFVGNNFISNLAHCMMDASVIERTSWSESGRGNFWSDYNGYDLDGDGVGDVPHSLQDVFEYIESNHPAVRFYLYSPASQLLEEAEKRMPILRRVNIEDPDPLFHIKEDNRVPWEKMNESEGGKSIALAAVWLIIACLPAAAIARLRRW